MCEGVFLHELSSMPKEFTFNFSLSKRRGWGEGEVGGSGT